MNTELDLERLDLGPRFKMWRPGQATAVEQILSLWRDGVRLVLMNGPTGSGKSLVGVAAASLLTAPTGGKVTVLTQTKELQQQYVSHFNGARAATGRANWTCLQTGRSAATCPRILDGCEFACEYRLQREAARVSRLRVINYAYYGATWPLFQADAMVADEGDGLGEILQKAHGVDLTPLGLGDYEGILSEEDEKELVARLRELRDHGSPQEKEAAKRAMRLTVSWPACRVVKGTLLPWPESTVVQDFASQPALVMSATIFAPQYWGSKWGVEVGWVELPCPTPAYRRPIRLMNVRRLSHRSTEEDWDAVVEALDRIISQRLEYKGLIHSVSNKLTDRILQKSAYQSLMVKASGEGRLQGIRSFLEAERGILIGPNLLRGIDLEYDHCRWIVFPKLPYPDMTDPQVERTLREGGEAYEIATLTALIQGAGRGVRHKDDYCETFILDSGAGWLFKRTYNWLPTWFKEAIVWREGGRSD